jgi:hypothetical protein
LLWALQKIFKIWLKFRSKQIHLPSLPLLLIPLTASLVYAVALNIVLTFPGLQVLYAITMPLGFVLLGVSIYKTIFRVSKNA